MKYLVIGDSNSMHIYNFVNTVLLPQNYEIHLLTLSARPIRDEYLEFYHRNGVVVHSVAVKGYKGLEKKDRFHRLLNLIRKLKLMKEVPQVDICHVQSVYKTALMMVRFNRKKYKKLILSYWGGDIEDKSSSVVNLRKKCFPFADAITVTVKETFNEFQRLYGHDYDEKLSICRFATDGLNCIHDLSKIMSKNECREVYGVETGKICITCGYSAYAVQHQDGCLEAMQRLPEGCRRKIAVYVPMQYGRFDEPYIQRVKTIAKQCDFPVTVLEEYVPFEKSVQLAMATDIYLHLRDTDAFSNALKEHVYSGSLVIKGDWLKYPELDEMNADILSIPSMDVLTDELTLILSNFKRNNELELFAPIFQLYSTVAIKEQWLEVIEKVTA